MFWGHLEYLLSKRMFICFVLLPNKLIISSDSGYVCVFIQRMYHVKTRENNLLNYSLTWNKSIWSLIPIGEAQMVLEHLQSGLCPWHVNQRVAETEEVICHGASGNENYTTHTNECISKGTI